MKSVCFIVFVLFFIQCDAQKNKLEYFTDYGKLSFVVEKKNCTGIYNQTGGMAGILDDTVFTGKWNQPGKGGDIRITFNSDFSKFNSRYNHADTKDSTENNWKTDWRGMKIPDTIIRKYQTPDGIINFRMIGTQVEGEYPLYNGKILGELVGNNFWGIWLQANRGYGILKIIFSPDFSSFEGSYNDYNFHPDKWGKWNGKLIN
jgi:hypothetical protein